MFTQDISFQYDDEYMSDTLSSFNEFVNSNSFTLINIDTTNQMTFSHSKSQNEIAHPIGNKRTKPNIGIIIGIIIGCLVILIILIVAIIFNKKYRKKQKEKSESIQKEIKKEPSQENKTELSFSTDSDSDSDLNFWLTFRDI